MRRCDYRRGINDVHMGKLNADLCTFLLVPTADIRIPSGTIRVLCADVSIAVGLLMFMWGKPNAEVLCFLLVPTADISIPVEK